MPTEQTTPKKTVEERIFLRLRRCGKFLTKRKSEQPLNPALLAHLTEEEKKQLARLLKKCCDEWKQYIESATIE